MAIGPLGEPCAERICSLRGYHFIPVHELASSSQRDPGIGLRLGDYLLTGLLGSGGFGKVYRALQLPVGMPAAVKVLDPERGPASFAQVKQTKFEVEAQALARLSHPNIVRLYHYGLHHGAPYLAMELIEDATTLWGEIEARAVHDRPFTLDEIESILGQTMAAIEAAHLRDLIHRDIKPENIMLQVVPGHGLFVKVLDFGLAKYADDRSATSMLLGTPAYMAPEQLTRGRIGPWSDIYALSVVAFELLTGSRPFPGASVQETIAHKLDPHFDPWSRVAHLGLPQEVRAFFTRGLALELEARYLAIEHMRQGLAAAIEALRVRGDYRVTVRRLVEPTLLHEPIPAAVVVDMTRRLARPPSADERAPAPAVMPLSTSAVGPVTDRRRWVGLSPTTRGVLRPGSRKGWALLVLLLVVVAGLIVVWVMQSRKLEGHTAVTPTNEPASSVVKVVLGRFARGTAPHDPAFRADEALHEVELTGALWVDTTEVTQARWAAHFATRPWRHIGCGAACPVESVSWWDAAAFANAVSQRDGLAPCYELGDCKGTPGDGRFVCASVKVGLACLGWRLPTEAEWEYLARAQSPPPDLSRVAWSARNSGADWGVEPCVGASPGGPRCAIHPVAQREANAFGLHDVFGNVREWVQDGYGPYPAGTAKDPRGLERATTRVIRGGSFQSSAAELRAAARGHADPNSAAIDVGLRLVRAVK
jgi:serine/threonine protein kinase/formylglycine-generating enzyme required for sulfatase activity